MAGNTRGKLKEHFEGIHRDIDWILDHINKSLSLIDTQLRQQNQFANPVLNDEELQSYIDNYPMYKAIKQFGEVIQSVDDMAMGIYSKM